MGLLGSLCFFLLQQLRGLKRRDIPIIHSLNDLCNSAFIISLRHHRFIKIGPKQLMRNLWLPQVRGMASMLGLALFNSLLLIIASQFLMPTLDRDIPSIVLFPLYKGAVKGHFDLFIHIYGWVKQPIRHYSWNLFSKLPNNLV